MPDRLGHAAWLRDRADVLMAEAVLLTVCRDHEEALGLLVQVHGCLVLAARLARS